MFKIVIKYFIWDTPARALRKFTKGHCGYNACERCSIYGVYSGNFHPVIHLESNCESKSDASFRNQDDEECHVGLPSLLNLERIQNVFGKSGDNEKLLSYWAIDTRYKYKFRSNSIENQGQLHPCLIGKPSNFLFFFALLWAYNIERYFVTANVPKFLTFARCVSNIM